LNLGVAEELCQKKERTHWNGIKTSLCRIRALIRLENRRFLVLSYVKTVILLCWMCWKCWKLFTLLRHDGNLDSSTAKMMLMFRSIFCFPPSSMILRHCLITLKDCIWRTYTWEVLALYFLDLSYRISCSLLRKCVSMDTYIRCEARWPERDIFQRRGNHTWLAADLKGINSTVSPNNAITTEWKIEIIYWEKWSHLLYSYVLPFETYWEIFKNHDFITWIFKSPSNAFECMQRLILNSVMVP